MIVEINAALQAANVLASGIGKIYNKVKAGTDSKLLAAFDCKKHDKNFYYIDIVVFNNSNNDIAELDILCKLGDTLKKITNGMIIPKNNFVQRDLLRVLITMDGSISIYTMNGKFNIDEQDTLIFQIDGEQYEINIDFREIVSYVVGI